ncbi:MAG: lipocalin-like domain-containing protein [bacterium]
MTSNPLVGTWKLISCEFVNEGGDITLPYGDDAVAYIMYTDDGYMSFSLMTANRADIPAGDIFGATRDEKCAAVDSYSSYSGRYELLEDRVIHHVDISLIPNWVGSSQVRFFEFDGDLLKLTTPPMVLDNKERVGRLVWRRAIT